MGHLVTCFGYFFLIIYSYVGTSLPCKTDSGMVWQFLNKELPACTWLKFMSLSIISVILYKAVSSDSHSSQPEEDLAKALAWSCLIKRAAVWDFCRSVLSYCLAMSYLSFTATESRYVPVSLTTWSSRVACGSYMTCLDFSLHIPCGGDFPYL